MKRKFVLKAIIPDGFSESIYTVYLFNVNTKILIPIKVSKTSAEQVILTKNYKSNPRPSIYNTIRRLINLFDSIPDSVMVYKSLDGIFYAYLRLLDGSNVYDIDLKFSDALALSYELDVPLYVGKKVYMDNGIKVTKELIENSLSEDN